MSAAMYADFGIRTRQGVYWLTVVMVVAALNAVVLHAARTQEIYRSGVAVVWVIAVMTLTVRALRRLGALEKEHPEPTEAMKLLFQLALAQPILGCGGLMLALR